MYEIKGTTNYSKGRPLKYCKTFSIVTRDELPKANTLEAVVNAFRVKFAQGFEGVDDRLVHTIDSPLTYDRRNIPSKMSYRQCLLSAHDLFAKGAFSKLGGPVG